VRKKVPLVNICLKYFEEPLCVIERRKKKETRFVLENVIGISK
jgi:hypothetical protein